MALLPLLATAARAKIIAANFSSRRILSSPVPSKMLLNDFLQNRVFFPGSIVECDRVDQIRASCDAPDSKPPLGLRPVLAYCEQR